MILSMFTEEDIYKLSVEDPVEYSRLLHQSRVDIHKDVNRLVQIRKKY